MMPSEDPRTQIGASTGRRRETRQSETTVGSSSRGSPSEINGPARPDDEAFVSYSQNGEDVRLWRVFREVRTGFYVDVGAADPTAGSVTRAFYDRGWSGINIEPAPSFATRLAAERPRDVNLSLAVGETDGMVPFYVTYPDVGMSTLRPETHAHVSDAVERVEEITVLQRRLDDVLEEHLAGRTIHFLKVDAEGAENQVLASCDWTVHRPMVMVVEAVAAWSSAPTYGAWESVLLEAGYQFAAFDGINRFYVHERYAELAPRLAFPISPLDRFIPAAMRDLEVECQAAQTRLEEVLAGLRMREKESADLKHKNLQLTRYLKSREEEIAALRQASSELEGRNSQLARDLSEATRTGEELRSTVAALLASRTWRAGRILADLASPGGTARRLARRRRFRASAPSPAKAFARAVAPGQPWHFPTKGSPSSRWRRRSAIESAHASFGSPDMPLDRARAAELADELERLAWGDDEALLARRFASGERRAIVEAAAVARMVSQASGTDASGRRPPFGSCEPVVVVDARCLQDPLYVERGVGVHARAVLESIRAVVATEELVLLTSATLPDLGDDVLALADRVVATVYALRNADVGLFVELSPMTHDVTPFTWIRRVGRCPAAGVVYDFIPTAFPSAYLRSPTVALTNRVRLEALRYYDLLLPISEATAGGCRTLLGRENDIVASGVSDTLPDLEATHTAEQPFMLVPVGGDSRKNAAAALAALGLHLKLGGEPMEAVVTGRLTPDQEAALVHLASSLGLPERALKLRGHVSPSELVHLLESAELVAVPSLAEGYSIPVVQAIRRGTPVVASDIPPHRELLGTGPWLADPLNVERLARAISEVRANRERTLAEQRATLGDAGERDAVTARLRGALAELQAERPNAPRQRHRSSGRPRLAVVSPFPPQHSGVADYTAYTFEAVSRYADVEFYSSARVADNPLSVRPISAEPYLNGRYDAVVNVLGNSHFHFPMLDLLETYGGATIAHDNRMFEAYRHDRGDACTATLISGHSRAIDPNEIGQLVGNLDLLPSLGYREIARNSSPLIVHGRGLANRIREETGVLPFVVDFVPYKVPRTHVVEEAQRRRARMELGLEDGTAHVATFGIVDSRTKGEDRLVGAVSWLDRWGVAAHLHVIGECSHHERQLLEALARELGIADCLTFYGRVGVQTLEQFHLAVDAAVQLRTSSLLSLSGALADCIAFGIPTVTTHDLAQEMGAPFYVKTTGSATSSLLVAEALHDALEVGRLEAAALEAARREYLARRSPDGYARAVLSCLGLLPLR